MIIRKGCFETNSSSTHAFCIGQGKHLKTPFELLNEYKSGLCNFDDYGYSLITSEADSFDSESVLLHYIDKKAFDNFLNEVQSDENWNNRNMYLILSRYTDIGRTYARYDSFHGKLNFIWTCLIAYYKRDDNYICDLQNKYKINIKESFNLFISYLINSGFKLFSTDILFKQVNTKSEDYAYATPVNLGITLKDNKLPKEWQNKKMIGIETYGYFPIVEICEILKDSLLFWNLVLGNSIIYTGSDEDSSFEDLDFSSYKVHLVGSSDWGYNLKVDNFKYQFPVLLGSYINGNYETKIYSDGTRTRELLPKDEYYYENGMFKSDLFSKNEIDLMKPEFPESIDLKITNCCNNNCEFCYANSSKLGKHGDKLFIKNIISQMQPYTEVAIGGGNPLEHPDLIEILEYAKERKVICNLTLKDIDVINHTEFINSLYQNNLIKAIGISPSNIETLSKLKDISLIRFDFILHLILGIHTLDFIKQIESKYFDKILILGYKNIGKGKNYFEGNKELIEKNIKEVGEYITKCNSRFKVNTISFDNLAIRTT